MSPPDNRESQIESAIRTFWQTMPSREHGARIMAAMSVLANKTGPDKAVSMICRLSEVAHRLESVGWISKAKGTYQTFAVFPGKAGGSEAEALERLLDELVMALREAKRREAPRHVVQTPP